MNFKYRLRNTGCFYTEVIDPVYGRIKFLITIYFIDTVNNQ